MPRLPLGYSGIRRAISNDEGATQAAAGDRLEFHVAAVRTGDNTWHGLSQFAKRIPRQGPAGALPILD